LVVVGNIGRYQEFAMEINERCAGGFGKGMAAGLAAGLIGTIVMSSFQSAWGAASKALKDCKSGEGAKDEQQQQASQNESEDATMKAAGKIASISGKELSHEQKKQLGPVVHYSFGTLQGGLYGTILELTGCRGGILAGLAFGAALFVAADEIGVPAAGLSGKPTESPLSSHLYGLAAHLVYGVSTEIARLGLKSSF
jgi:putative membrane protein